MPASLKERVSRRRKVRAAEIASSPRQRRLDDRPQRRLQPHLTGKRTTPPHDALYWRWVAQAAIREGKWKLLRGGGREYLEGFSLVSGDDDFSDYVPHGLKICW